MGLAIGAVVLLVAGFNPVDAYIIIWNGIFSKPKYLAYVIIYATPLIITGLSVAFAFRQVCSTSAPKASSSSEHLWPPSPVTCRASPRDPRRRGLRPRVGQRPSGEASQVGSRLVSGSTK
jgi:hypothetical protein